MPNITQWLKAIACAIVACTLCLSIVSANTVSISRYQSVSIKPQSAQTHLLNQHIEVVFPQNVITLKQAMQFILRFSGYQLTDDNLQSKSVRKLLQQPLPEVDRHFGPLTLQQGLTTLAGEPFTLVIDPIHRLISYKLKFAYEHLYQ